MQLNKILGKVHLEVGFKGGQVASHSCRRRQFWEWGMAKETGHNILIEQKTFGWQGEVGRRSKWWLSAKLQKLKMQ